MLDPISTDASPDLYTTIRVMETENGILGKFFGGYKQAPFNIAGYSITILFCLLAYSIATDKNIDLLFSSITMILGFLFGKGTS